MGRKILLCSLLWSAASSFVFAQTGSVGIGTTTPSNSAILDLQSTSKGFLMPRVSTAQRKAIASPAPGLLVFDTDKNCLYIFDGTTWQAISAAGGYNLPITEREPTDGEIGDRFGYSVSISGDYAIVGAPRDNIGSNTWQGSAYIFFKQEGNWIQQAKLTANDGAIFDEFGYSVAISGDFAVVGSPFDDQIVLPLGNSPDRGAIYVFRRTGTVWTQLTKLSADDGASNNTLGNSVSISGNYIVAGAKFGDNAPSSNQGAAYIFFYNGTSWSQQSKLIASNGATNDQFGTSVSISGDYAVVGAPNHAVDGAAYIYFRFGTIWVFDQMIPDATLLPTDVNFGISVCIYDTLVVVGANTQNTDGVLASGGAYVFARNGTVWDLSGIMDAADKEVSDNLGVSVAIFGTTAIACAPRDNVGAFGDQGSAYVFKPDAGIWLADRKIEVAGNGEVKYFGSSVAMDGFNFVIGAPSFDSRKGKVFFLNIE